MKSNNLWAWHLNDLKKVPQNGLKVMSTFACGGGSSMGYKRAGCTLVAANDIDPEMAYHYKLNLNPEYYFLCPVKDLVTAKLPSDLFSLDILDGSPPCSSFSVAGDREKTWGKKKHFREGQAAQILDDLFFDYLALVDRLRPRVAIAENVKGMILGNAKGYVRMVMARFREIGYRPQLFLVNSADCGVPQKRERVFFCALRDDCDRPKLTLAPKHRWISAQEAIVDLRLTDEERKITAPGKVHRQMWAKASPGEAYSQVLEREGILNKYFNWMRVDGDKPMPTLASSSASHYAHWSECRIFSFREWKRFGSFPDDYQAKSDSIGKYMIGMSVPPKMTEAIASAVIDQWLT